MIDDGTNSRLSRGNGTSRAFKVVCNYTTFYRTLFNTYSVEKRVETSRREYKYEYIREYTIISGIRRIPIVSESDESRGVRSL